jgi:sulfide dehydrogenase [flavocytochrome c] flavoprotein chain
MNAFQMSRRRFGQGLGSAGALGALGGLSACATSGSGAPPEAVKKLGRVLVVGAGFGGATAAKYLKQWGGAGIEVMLVDRQREFISCPMSNLVLGGSRQLADMTVSYEGLRRQGVIVINDEVLSIDSAKRRASFNKIADQSFDRIIVSPGVDFDYSTVQGYDGEAQKTILSAWKAGPETLALQAQLQAMPDGGVYVLSIPTAPYRCPPGPYERACQVAYYFKNNKPRSKVIVLDANPDIVSKAGLFKKAFNDTYKGMIEYRPNSKITELDAKGMTVVTELGDKTKGDVVNVLPQMSAGRIARLAGLVNANNRWCAVDWMTMESTAAPGVHVLGDSTLSAALMPKSGHMANQHGKTAAAAIVEIMNGRAPIAPMMANTCYSFIDNSNVVHVASVHRYVAEKKTMEVVAGAGGLSSEANALEGVYANAWAQNIWNDMLS